MRRIAPVGLLLVALLLPASAHAGFPGTNGRIAFETNRDGNFEIYSMNADGSDQRNLTHSPAYDTLPAWSPDGTKIAFTSDRDGKYDVYVMNADGSDVRRVTSGTARNVAAGWSPDGTKILFDSDELLSGPGGRESDVMVVNLDGTGATPLTTDPATDEYGALSPGGDQIAFTSTRDGNEDVYTMNADGSAQTNITNTTNGYFNPDWSPDGSRIAVDRASILVMNPDGTGRVNISNPRGSDFNPAWSPDGTRIAFDTWRDGNSEIYSMSPDGTGQARLTSDPAADTYPDWQPIPVRYARPKGATPFRVPLVTAIQQCTAPNRTHGAPLAFPSCRFPRQVYPFVTVGTPDANGAPAKSVGYVQFDVTTGMPGPPDDAHVYISAKVSDVRCGAAVDPPPPSAAGLCDSGNDIGFPDYGGALEGRVSVRITDTLNFPDPSGAGPGTMSDYAFAFPAPCATSADATVGSTCSAATEADAVVPGMVPEGRRAIWQMGQVNLYAADSSAPPDALFETQGVFVP